MEYKKNQEIKEVAKGVLMLAPVLINPIAGLVSLGATPTYFITKKTKLDKQILETQYNCAVLKFYLDDMRMFLGM